MSDELFRELPELRGPARDLRGGAVRTRNPDRDQKEFRSYDLDSLLGAEHSARVIWDYVQKLNLSELEDRIKAREHTRGQAPASPQLYMALWLYATSDGVGSARALARLCEEHNVYRWLCGGVSMNHHGLSDFRTEHGELLDRLLTQSVASLAEAGVISLDEVVQDGVKVRAAAGSSSFRRRSTLEEKLEQAKELVQGLRDEIATDGDAGNRRRRAAQERAARERQERTEAALKKMEELEAERERRMKTNKTQVEKQKEPRASTTDEDARVMKMADGGFRPAFNCQIATVAQGQIVVGATVTDAGSDRGLMRPMLDEIYRRFERRPARYLVDGGFAKSEDTEWAAGQGVEVYGRPGQTRHKTNPLDPHPGDSPEIAAWRARMKSDEGQAIYKRRSMGEWINACLRNRGLQQFLVRSLAKVQAVLLWQSLVNNILAGHRLMRDARQVAAA